MTTMQTALKGAELKVLGLRAADEATKRWPRATKKYPATVRVEIRTGNEAHPQ